MNSAESRVLPVTVLSLNKAKVVNSATVEAANTGKVLPMSHSVSHRQDKNYTLSKINTCITVILVFNGQYINSHSTDIRMEKQHLFL